MKQMAVDGDPPFLPQEILTNILKRLPIKSLIQFQCVCKQWKNLIKTPSFMADQFHHSSNQNPLLLLQWDDSFDPLHLYMLDYEKREHQVQVQSPPLIYSSTLGQIVGTSNGLLCLGIHSEGMSPPSYLLWNPAIREVRQVPRTIDNFDRRTLFGFGFSPIVNDYKIFISRLSVFDKADNRVEAYSLRTGSWKEIQVGNLGGVQPNLVTAVTTNGAMFWFGSKQGCDVIVSFDIALEVFTLIPIPAFNPDSHGRPAVYENTLALFEIENSGSSLINLWVMEEGTAAFSERWSWTKKYTISTSSDYFSPFGIWGNEIVCNIRPGHLIYNFIDEPEEAIDGVVIVLSLLNLSTHDLENFATRRCGVYVSVALNYAESLVPVCNIHIEDP